MTDSKPLAGKTAVVTGSTQGLGATTAQAVRRARCRRHRRHRPQCRARKCGSGGGDHLAALGCEAVFVPAELDSVEDCRRIITAADEAFGTLDILVNAGALTERGHHLGYHARNSPTG